MILENLIIFQFFHLQKKKKKMSGGGGKIVRAFAEVMKNMSRMKACVRPAMCKPYGKQSEALQKSKYI